MYMLAMLCVEELPDYVIVAIVLGFLLVVVLIVALLAYRFITNTASQKAIP